MLIQLLKNEDGSEATMDLIGAFDDEGWGLSAEKAFVRQFRSLAPDARLTINLNSPGGSVFQALSIRNLLAQHQGEIVVNVLGWAASAATFITSLPNVRTIMCAGSFLMIHNPWNIAMGNQHDLRRQADTLELLAHEMARFYSEKSGMGLAEVQRLMDAETWFTAEEAVEKGLADELNSFAKVAASATAEGVPVLGGVALTGGISQPRSFVIEGKDMADKTKQVAVNEAAEIKDKVSPQAEEITTLEALQAKYPSLTQALTEHAVKAALDAERARMQSLDSIRAKAPEIVDKAKYETFTDAATTALEILQHGEQVKEERAQTVAEDAKAVADSLAKLDVASNPAAGETSQLTGTIAASDAWIQTVSKIVEGK